MQKFLDLLERCLAAILSFVIDHVPMPGKLRNALRARRDVLHEIAKFGVAGVGATVTFFVVYNVLLLATHETFSTAWALVIANIPAIAVAYFISKRFVFAQSSGGRGRTAEMVMFFALNAVAVAIGFFAVAGVEWLLGVEKLNWLMANLVPAAAILLSWGLRFVVSRRFIFKAHLERPAVDMATELAHFIDEVEEEERTGEIRGTSDAAQA